MSAPVLWVLFPLCLAGLLILIGNSKSVFLVGCLSTFFLTLAAWLLPIDTALTLGKWTIQLIPSIVILGRNFTLSSSDRSFLALIYGSAFFWFLPSITLKTARNLIPLGLAVTAMLVAAISVEPFLYAALIIEAAVLLSIPMLTTRQQKPPRGVVRFLIFQTLAVPFILLSGRLLAGIGANPGNMVLIDQAAILLGLGFAFLLAIFPFYTWIPLLAEEAHPYMVGFLFWLLPTVTLFWGLGFLDQFPWLRDAAFLPAVLTTAGTLMVVSGGILSAFQSNLGRIMGYATIVSTGFSLLALSMESRTGLGIFFLLLVPRTLSLGIWAYSLAILKEQTLGLSFKAVRGMGRKWPFVTAGLTMANLALAGLPFLAGFPAQQEILEGLARNSLPITICVLGGCIGLLTGAVRSLGSLTSSPNSTKWTAGETQMERLFIFIGVLGLLLLGIFPQWIMPLWTRLPVIFEHLGQ